MGKFKKILSTFVILISLFTFSIIKVDAATGTVTMSANKSQVVVGNTVTFTVKVSSTKALGVFQYNLSYDSSKLTLTSGDPSGAPVFSGKEKSVTYTFKFKAKKDGTATVKFNVSGGYTFAQETLSLASKSKSVKIITQAQLEASYSKNNNLSSLSVEGYSLSPKFSSSITSYTVNLPANTESIKVNGKKADSSASVDGLGTKTVEDGSNTIKIVVTAENGATKTYTINAIVEELDPINVTVNDKAYTVVRKAKLLTSPSSDFTEGTATINDNEVPTLFNEKANITLVGLKDEDGNIELYIYDQEKNTYTKYNQYTFSGLTLYIVDKELENYDKKETITINEQKVISYTFEKDNFYYFYAINLESGKENIYCYDNDEKTVQRYIATEEEKVVITNDSNEDLYRYIIIGLLGFIFLTYLIILLNLLFKGRKKKIKNDFQPIEKPIIEANISAEEKNEQVDDNKVSNLEKEKYLKESEEELKRINTSNPTETNDVVDTINEILEDDSNKKEKKKTKKKKKNKKD